MSLGLGGVHCFLPSYLIRYCQRALKSPAVTVELFIFPFSSVSFCLCTLGLLVHMFVIFDIIRNICLVFDLGSWGRAKVIQ